METETFAGKTVSRSFNQYEDFNVGDIVMLRSGGPKMTVDGTAGSRYVCVWFDGTTFHRQTFDQGALMDGTGGTDWIGTGDQGALEKVPTKDTDLSPA